MAHQVWRLHVAGLLTAAVAQCVPYRRQANPLVSAPHDYSGALVFAATGVAAASGYRAVNGGCYSQCANGYACNATSGLCEKRLKCPTDLSKVDDPDCLDGEASTPANPPADLTPPPLEADETSAATDAGADVDSPSRATPTPARVPFRVE